VYSYIRTLYFMIFKLHVLIHTYENIKYILIVKIIFLKLTYAGKSCGSSDKGLGYLVVVHFSLSQLQSDCYLFLFNILIVGTFQNV